MSSAPRPAAAGGEGFMVGNSAARWRNCARRAGPALRAHAACRLRSAAGILLGPAGRTDDAPMPNLKLRMSAVAIALLFALVTIGTWAWLYRPEAEPEWP